METMTRCTDFLPNVGRCWMKSLNKIKLDPTSSNIMQQYPTWCSNGPNMLDTTMLDDVGPTCCIRLINYILFQKKCKQNTRMSRTDLTASLKETSPIQVLIYLHHFHQVLFSRHMLL